MMEKRNPNPPKAGDRILKTLLEFDDYREKSGDFEEVFSILCTENSRVKACLWYWLQVFITIAAISIKEIIWSYAVIKNYLKTAFRNIKKHKSFSFINISGLSLGMSVCLFIIKFVMFLYSFDGFHDKKDRIFLVSSNRLTKSSGYYSKWDRTPAPLASVLKNDCRAVENIAKLSHSDIDQISRNNKTLEAKTVFTDKGFFDIFNVNFKYGESSQFTSSPNSIVITDKVAERFFLDENPVGRIMNCGKLGDMIITGVIYEIPHNSEFHDFEVMVSYSVLESYWKNNPDSNLESWTALNKPGQTVFCLIKENSSRESVETFLAHTAEKYIENEKYTFSFFLLPLCQYVFQSDLYGNSFGIEFPPYMLYSMVFCAFSILIIACFNYTNLCAAKSLTRLKEVGMRKVIGAGRSQLFIQFVLESLVLSLLAFVTAVFLQKIIISLFLGMHSEVSLMFRFEDSFTIYFLFVIFALLTGIFSGLLPAFYFSRPRPIDIFTNFAGNRLFSGITVRKILISFQFAFSFFFIILTVSAYNQFKYAEEFDLGINTGNIVNVNLDPGELSLFKKAISRSAYISKISASSSKPGIQFSSSVYAKKLSSADSTRIRYIAVDNNFIENLELEIIAGSNFPETANIIKENFIIINETASEALGFQNPGDAINKGILLGNNMINIIGVVKDFTHDQYYSSISPLALRSLPDKLSYLNIRTSTSNRENVIKYLEKKWSELYPNELFICKFYDEEIVERNLFSRVIMMFGMFVSIIAVIIASLGLLGIFMYTVQTKIKEISIRKILGAGAGNLVKILSKGYVILVLISAFIAVPAAVYINNLALQDIQNKADLGIGSICFGITLILLLGFFTILIQIAKAVFVNPVESLRRE